MTLTYEDRTTLTHLSYDANRGVWPQVHPELFKKLLQLAYQAEAQNTGPVRQYFEANSAS